MEWRIKVFGPLAQTRRRSEFTMNLAETVLTVADKASNRSELQLSRSPLATASASVNCWADGASPLARTWSHCSAAVAAWVSVKVAVVYLPRA